MRGVWPFIGSGGRLEKDFEMCNFLECGDLAGFLRFRPEFLPWLAEQIGGDRPTCWAKSHALVGRRALGAGGGGVGRSERVGAPQVGGWHFELGAWGFALPSPSGSCVALG
jgi:hypothetical protein